MRRDVMRATTDDIHEGPDPIAPLLPEARGTEDILYALPETEASCEEIAR
jgi:hypothetical protein